MEKQFTFKVENVVLMMIKLEVRNGKDTNMTKLNIKAVHVLSLMGVNILNNNHPCPLLQVCSHAVELLNHANDS